MQVCALKVSASARKRIEKAGGQIITFDQLATISPTGQNTVLVQGNQIILIIFTFENIAIFILQLVQSF